MTLEPKHISQRAAARAFLDGALEAVCEDIADAAPLHAPSICSVLKWLIRAERAVGDGLPVPVREEEKSDD